MHAYRQFLDSDAVNVALNTSKSPLTAIVVLKKICNHPYLLQVLQNTRGQWNSGHPLLHAAICTSFREENDGWGVLDTRTRSDLLVLSQRNVADDFAEREGA